MRWLSLAPVALVVAVAACGDDDRAAAAPSDAGADAPVADAGRPPVIDIDPQIVPKPNPFWHIERPPGTKRTWMVSPDGARTFVLGLDSVFRTDECAGMPAYTQRAPDAAKTEWSRLTETLHFNAVGAFGSLDAEGAPYSIVVSLAPRGDDRALRDATGNVLLNGLSGVKIGDPYNPAYQQDLHAIFAESIQPHKADKRLQIIYLDHEDGIFDIAGPGGGVRDFRKWIWTSCPATSTLQRPHCAAHALLQSLHTTYPDIATLNASWGTSYGSFEAITGPATVCNAKCSADLLQFVRERLLATWVDVVTLTARSYSDKHVIATPRLALGTSKDYRFFSPTDTWADDGQPIGSYDPYPLLSKFDLIALDAYAATPTYEEPWLGDGLHKLHAESQLPAIVSEMGTRVNVPGWSNTSSSLEIAFVNTEAERGDRYATQLAQLAAFPDVVGVVSHAWSDRFVPGDPTRQLHEGLVQCDDAPRSFTAGALWTDFASRVTTANLSASKIE